MTKTGDSEIRERVTQAARSLQIEPLLQRRPRQLSGGQRQRVAIGRAIVRKPKLFLFDEPLSNLDAELRTQMRVEIARLHKALGATMVYVTHDQIEAMTLADRIAVLREGVVEQFGTPAELYDRPDNIFVAGFIGSPKMNFIDAAVAGVSGASLTLESAAFTNGKMSIRTSKVKQMNPGQKIILGMRPEHVSLGGKQTQLALRADISENLGGTTQIHAMAATGEPVVILASGRPDIVLGQPLSAGIAAANIYLFNEQGAAL
jgi:ABC-type sugar transport system ATPase subunit